MNPKARLTFGLYFLGALTLFFLLVLLLSPYDPVATNLEKINSPPSFSHLFGTDELGRDILVRTAHGVLISMAIGLTAFLVDLLIGASLGIFAALSPSWLEMFLTRGIELVYSLPYLLVVILLSVYTGTGIIPIFCAILCIGWIHMSRVAYQVTKSALVEGWALAAKAIGLSKGKLLIAHILPNSVHLIFTTALLSIPSAIFTESFLSFLGVGIAPPQASLGSMVSDALPAIRYYPWRLFAPALTIASLILSITLIQEAVRDLFDPHMKKKKPVFSFDDEAIKT